MYGNHRTSASALPPGAQQPAATAPSHAFPAYTFEVTPPPYQEDYHLNFPPPPPNVARPRVRSMHEPNSVRPSGLDFQRPRMPFPEPQPYRPTSQQRPTRPQQKLTRHYSHSDLGTSSPSLTETTQHWHHNPSVTSFAASYGSGSNEVHYSSIVYVYIDINVNRHTMTNLES